ncbi:hypothetical protein VZ95_10055 [Elstera litoralis]|uniref:Uncharacterized protein n=1 Tax=Elstera litoralis TaxID=552518 RepID=A0A0F3ISI7_9PROT|nr:hypothetical protein [Elstera litoralis]KJV09666.1 hypothetical protein VZ95_10055 [Elstera litoralis]
MSDEAENLVLVYLRRLDTKVDAIKDDLQDVKARLNRVENSLITMRREQTNDAEGVAHLEARFDRFSERLARIEKRLEITDA